MQSNSGSYTGGSPRPGSPPKWASIPASPIPRLAPERYRQVIPGGSPSPLGYGVSPSRLGSHAHQVWDLDDLDDPGTKPKHEDMRQEQVQEQQDGACSEVKESRSCCDPMYGRNDSGYMRDYIVMPSAGANMNGRASRTRSLSSAARASSSTSVVANSRSAIRHPQQFLVESIRTVGQPELKRLYRLIKNENAVVSSYKASSSQMLGSSQMLADWGANTGDCAVGDITEKLGVILSEIGEQEAAYAKNIEESRLLLKEVRDTEFAVQPTRKQNTKIKEEIIKCRGSLPDQPGAMSKLSQLEQALVRYEAMNLVGEAQLYNVTRRNVKNAYGLYFAAIVERCEREMMMARAGHQLLSLLDDRPVLPGGKSPEYGHFSESRQVLLLLDDQLKRYESHVPLFYKDNEYEESSSSREWMKRRNDEQEMRFSEDRSVYSDGGEPSPVPPWHSSNPGSPARERSVPSPPRHALSPLRQPRQNSPMQQQRRRQCRKGDVGEENNGQGKRVLTPRLVPGEIMGDDECAWSS